MVLLLTRRMLLLSVLKGKVEVRSHPILTYDTGQGAAQNYEEARRWYLATAEPFNTEAKFNRGLLYANGETVIQDDATAYMWF